MKEFVKLGLNCNSDIDIDDQHLPQEEIDEVATEEFYSSVEKVCDAVPKYDMKQ
jgi:hypothetical protein